MEDPILFWRLPAALLLAGFLAWWVQRGSRRAPAPPGLAEPVRAGIAFATLTGTMALAVCLPLVTADLPQDVDLEALGYGQLFLSHGLLLAAVVLWAALAWARLPRPAGRLYRAETAPAAGAPASGDPAGDWASGLRLRTGRPVEDVAVGLLGGLMAWAAVLATMLVLAALLALAGRGEGLLDAPPSPLIVFIAGLPVVARVLVSLSAGVVEELFFRGFLQPRIGLAASTACFVAGHLAYEQPLMLVGLTVLSIIYGRLARRRGNIWASVVAHTVFDAVQLLVVIPAALASGGPTPVA